MTYPVGATIEFSFLRYLRPNEDSESFYRSRTTLKEDTTISAVFDYSKEDQEPGAVDPEVPDELPDSGAGGMAGLPWGNIGALSLMAAAGYAVLKRR